MRLLVLGDLHLKPSGSDYDLDGITPPEHVDMAVILGDLTHRAGPGDIDLARRFVERLALSLPVVYVPGNHDPHPTAEQVVDPISRAVSGHQTVREFAGLTLVGWGCERRSLSPSIDQSAFDALDPRNASRENRRYFADQIAADIESACFEVVCGSASPEQAAESLQIKDDERSAFRRGLTEIEATYDQLGELVENRDGVLLATHVPPFNTSFDRHHAVGARDENKEYLHVGSIALKLAIREYDVFAALSGHSHTFGYDLDRSAGGGPHYLNLGYRGIGTVSAIPEHGEFTYSRTSESQ